MYYKHKQWLEDASTDDKIRILRSALMNKKEEIWYLHHKMKELLKVISIYHTSLHKANLEYSQMDLELALIDGRFKICKPKEAPKTRTKRPKVDLVERIKGLPPDQVLKLIDELRRMK